MPSFINDLMLTEMKTLVDANPSFIVVEPSKLNSADTLKLRKDLRGVGAKMKMAKVSIIQRVVPQAAVKMVEGKGSIALVLATDMVGAAKLLAGLAKEDKVVLKGGLMDGLALDTAGVKRISELPSKQTLLGMLVNVLAAPLTGLARVIDEIRKKNDPNSAAPVAANAPDSGAPAA